MRRLSPFRIGLGLATTGVAVLAAPAAWEGPVLVEISPGHAIALLDAFGIVPLVLGSAILYRELWVRRRRLTFSASNRLDAGLGMAFAGGAGLGLLIASGFSGFFWWWAVGAVLFAAALVAATVIATGASEGPDRQ